MLNRRRPRFALWQTWCRRKKVKEIEGGRRTIILFKSTMVKSRVLRQSEW